MEPKVNTSLSEIFEELSEIHEMLGAGLSTLAVLERGAESPEMAEALGLLEEYMRTPFEDLGSLAEIGRRSVAG